MIRYEIRPRDDGPGVSLINEQLPFGVLWYGEPNAIANAASYAKFNAGSRRAVIQILDRDGSIVETLYHEPDARRSDNTLGRI